MATSTNRRSAAIVPWICLAALIAVGFWPTFPISTGEAQTGETYFSTGRAMAHIEAMAQVPHPIGSAEIEEVRRYIIDEVEELGLEVDLQEATVPDFYGDGGPVDLVNVVAWIPGADNSKAVLLIAHYDTVPATPGANDNSVSVASLLETARALQAGPRPRNDIVFLFTDGEEPAGRAGTTAFAAVPGLLDQIGLAVNFEASGGSGASMLAETSGPEQWLVEEYTSADSAPAAFSFLTELTRMIGEVGTDFDVFDDAGLPGLHFAYLRGSPIYHTAADSIHSVDAGTLRHHGTHALSVARHFGDLDLAAVPGSGRSVFFTVGRLAISYPGSWALPLAILLVAVLGWVLLRRRALLGVARWEPPRSVGPLTIALLAACVVGTSMWLLLAAVRSTPGVIEGDSYALAVLAVAAITMRWIALKGGGCGISHPAGWVMKWSLLAVATAAFAPGFSYLFLWPAAVGTASMVLNPRRYGASLARFLGVAAPTVLLTVPAIDTLFLFAQPRPGNPDSEMTVAAVAPLILGMMVVGLLASAWPSADAAQEEAKKAA